MPSRNPEEIAQRLNDYADQVTKFVFLQALAFAISLSNKAVFDLVATVPWVIVYGLWDFVNTVELIFVIACHLGEDELIGRPTRGNKADPWRRFIRFARLALIIGTAMTMDSVILTIRVYSGR